MLNNKLFKYSKLALAISSLSFISINIQAEEGAGEVERIEVTGSRIKRADMEGANPVQIIGP